MSSSKELIDTLDRIILDRLKKSKDVSQLTNPQEYLEKWLPNFIANIKLMEFLDELIDKRLPDLQQPKGDKND